MRVPLWFTNRSCERWVQKRYVDREIAMAYLTGVSIYVVRLGHKVYFQCAAVARR